MPSCMAGSLVQRIDPDPDRASGDECVAEAFLFRLIREPVLKTFYVSPNPFFAFLEERVRNDLFDPFLPDCKTSFSRIFYIFLCYF